jgi:hypothetical protein
MAMSEDKQIEVALEEATVAMQRMQSRGVEESHMAPSAFVMVGLRLLEGTCRKSSISGWLYKLADEYAQAAMEEKNKPPEP